MFRTVASLLLLGLSFGIGPCLATCGPILIPYIVGNKKNTLKSLGVYFLFSSARIAVYLVLGVAVFFLGRLIIEMQLARFSRYISVFFGIFLIIVGALTAWGNNLGQRQENGFCRFVHKNLLTRDKKNVILMGLITGLAPCAPLLALFAYLGLVSKTWVHALIYSFSFGLGTLLSPLLILSLLAGLIPNLLTGQKQVYSKILSFVCGLVIIFFGVQLIMRAHA